MELDIYRVVITMENRCKNEQRIITSYGEEREGEDVARHNKNHMQRYRIMRRYARNKE